ncbi:MAG: selenide,water dikinase [Pseudohongiellaceae bacterium]
MQVLSKLPKQTDPRLLVGSDHFDDAGVARLDVPGLANLGDDIALVQSVDFFPPVVDDPWWFGRIAAANALSDIYAMGATPFSVLNIVAFNTKKLSLDVLGTILEGGASAVAESGAMTLGGHSVEDEGVKFGMAVTGVLRPGKQTTNAAARPGDRLYLTKPLGTGTLTTAARKGKADADHLKVAMESMGALNAAAAQAMIAAGCKAATDITGFGMLGHAHEMAAGSGADVVLSTGALPWLDGSLELARKGWLSGGSARTLEYLGDGVVVEPGVDAELVKIAADSETSGGLLIAVAPEKAAALETELAARDVLVSHVGEVQAGKGVVRLTS